MDICISGSKPSKSEVYWIPYSWLKDNAVHLFVASYSWGNMHVELSEDIPSGVLRYMVPKCKTVTVELHEKATDKIVGLLCELYEDKAGAIRKAFIMDRDVMGVVRA